MSRVHPSACHRVKGLKEVLVGDSSCYRNVCDHTFRQVDCWRPLLQTSGLLSYVCRASLSLLCSLHLFFTCFTAPVVKPRCPSFHNYLSTLLSFRSTHACNFAALFAVHRAFIITTPAAPIGARRHDRRRGRARTPSRFQRSR